MYAPFQTLLSVAFRMFSVRISSLKFFHEGKACLYVAIQVDCPYCCLWFALGNYANLWWFLKSILLSWWSVYRLDFRLLLIPFRWLDFQIISYEFLSFVKWILYFPNDIMQTQFVILMALMHISLSLISKEKVGKKSSCFMEKYVRNYENKMVKE